jgi:hypothetical protein
VELTRAGVEKDCERAEGGGGDWLWSVVAAAAVNPKDRRAEGKRRSVEENSLKVFVGKRKRLYFRVEKREWADDEIRERFCVFPPIQINHLPASRPLAF